MASQTRKGKSSNTTGLPPKPITKETMGHQNKKLLSKIKSSSTRQLSSTSTARSQVDLRSKSRGLSQSSKKEPAMVATSTDNFAKNDPKFWKQAKIASA